MKLQYTFFFYDYNQVKVYKYVNVKLLSCRSLVDVVGFLVLLEGMAVVGRYTDVLHSSKRELLERESFLFVQKEWVVRFQLVDLLPFLDSLVLQHVMGL
jgi:hypothetical protein